MAAFRENSKEMGGKTSGSSQQSAPPAARDKTLHPFYIISMRTQPIQSTRIFNVAGRTRWFLLLLITILVSGPGATFLAGQSAPGQDRTKKVFAHHMGSLNAGRGAMAWYTHNPQLGDPSTSNGGDYRNLPIVPHDMTNLTLEESADLQIRRAMRIGIDGFAVNAWAGSDEAKRFLDALFKVAEENDYPFEISICPDANAIDQSNGFTNAIVDAIKYLLDRHGDSPKLARRDGKPIIFGYQSNWIWVEYLWRKYEDQELVDIARTTPEGWELIKDAFENIESLVGQQLYFQFEMGAFYSGLKTRGVPQDGYYRAAQVVAKHMPAVNEFLPSRHTADFARAAREAGSEWGHPVYMNYDNNRTNWSHGGPGTDRLRQGWQEARDLDSTLMQYTTWNDYHENTNVSPGMMTNYSYFDLTAYFIDWWKKGAQPAAERDRMYVFSRKYPRDAKLFPFQSYAATDGVIEVLTILPQAGRVRVPGRGEYEAPAGMFVKQFPVTPGPVSAELIRNNSVQLRVESPEPVTGLPFRQDNGIVGISSECERHWQADFGNIPMSLYSEYGDNDGDGLPNWFEMYWFGKLGDFSTATGVDPQADANGDGSSNLEDFQAQRSPVGTGGSLTARRPYGDTAAEIPGVIEAEHFDYGGTGVAYFDTVSSNQGGQLRATENVDIQTTTDAGGGHNVGWIAAGEWLEYAVDVKAPGIYDLQVRIASPDAGGRMRVLMEGKEVGAVAIPATGGWQSWQTLTVPVTLTAGPQTMRLAMDAGGFNFNFVEFIATAVNHPSVVTITSPSDGVSFSAGESIGIEADASDADGEIVRVEFFSGSEKIGEAVTSPYSFSWAGMSAGFHTLTARAVDSEGQSTTSAPVEIEVREGVAKRAPLGDVVVRLPGRVRAVDFDRGGQDVAYHDTTSSNQGNQFRTDEGVDIEVTSDTGGGFNVGWTESGEWLLYTVDVAEAGQYDLHLRVASINSGGHLHVEFEGTSSTRMDVPNTGGWQSWRTVTASNVRLEQGEQTLRLSFDTGGMNVNYLEVAPATAASPDVSYTAWQSRHFTQEELADPSISGDSADADGNGVPNLMEYALNRDPRGQQQSGGLPEAGTVALEGQEYLTLTFNRPAGVEDVVYQVEVSSDLKNWESDQAVVPVSVTPNGETETVVIRDGRPLENAPSRFIRLRVDRQNS